MLGCSLRFIYDGWNVLGEIDGSDTTVRSYVWGLDVSGTEAGAGGVGGLLFERSGDGTYVPTYDGNGNLLTLVDARSGSTSASYEYGPFGEPLRATGALAQANPFRWSTRYTENETGIVMYPLRSYQPSTGRWLSRDPIQEMGGSNLYGFVNNDPVQNFDYLGLSCRCECADSVKLTSYVDDKGTLKGNSKPRGGQIKWTISLTYPTCDPSVRGKEATLEYLENTNIPAIAGTTAGVTYDAHQLIPDNPGFNPWKNRKLIKYKSFDQPSDQFNLTDSAFIDPALIAQAGLKERVTRITVRVKSAPGCPCQKASAEHTVEQHIYRYPTMTDASVLIDLGGN